ncbi:hypothetical protein CLM62_24125 [Streptomyces sp. SA15]|nr:hypothetical protein CLM62_24125 [Streptomyces sp. SA15]
MQASIGRTQPIGADTLRSFKAEALSQIAPQYDEISLLRRELAAAADAEIYTLPSQPTNVRGALES